MRLMSNFGYKDAKGKIIQVPVRYGDMSRQVAQILNKNSENIVQSAPFIACYIKSMDLARERLQDPTFVSKVNLRERAFDEDGQEYLNTQGANYTVERLMPTPYNLQFAADIWTTNVDQKFQLVEQISVLFNPSMEIQTNSNFIDWTSLTTLELTGLTLSSRQVPQGLEQDIDIASMTFTTPIWITTPAKVKKLGIITNIITSMFADATGTIEGGAYSEPDVDYFTGRVSISVGASTIGNLGVLFVDGTAKLMREGESYSKSDDNAVPNKFGPDVNWNSILDLYPGKFTAGLSTIRFQKPDGTEIVGNISLDPLDDAVMHVSFDDPDTLPANTIIEDMDGNYPRGTVDAIVDPTTFNPRPYLPNGSLGWPATDYRLLILEDINYNVEAWQNQDTTYFRALANDIVQWDGVKWNRVFISADHADLTYITNSRTGVQYVWDGVSWMKSYEGVYSAGKWRLVL